MKTTRFLIVLAGILCVSTVYGTHWAGADFSFRCLGGNDYEITFSFYRDCGPVNSTSNSAAAPQTVNITFVCTSNSAFNFNVTLQRIPNTGQEITPGCSAAPTRCTAAPAGYGVQEYVYRGNVTLPPCNTWRMSYQLCCRNPNNTIQNPTSQNGYVEATLNNLLAPCKSSPTFTNKPITILCQGQTTCFNHGAIDHDGDSLSYELTQPLHNATTPLGYLGGYTYLQPLPSVPPVTCDPVTGDICMNPSMNIVTVMAVLIKQWRTINGVPTVVGTVTRDLQINVAQCNNTLPVLSGMDTTLSKGYDPTDTTYFIEICLGTPVNFNMWGYDADTYNPAVIGNPERFSIIWNNGIPGGTFTTYHNATDSAYANFQWNPTANDVSNIPKCFTATIQDEACPYYGTNTYSYCITVRGMWVDIGHDTLICRGESLTLTANADTTTINYIWKVNGVPTGTPLTSSVFVFNSANYPAGVHQISVETNDGGVTTQCPGLASIRVNVVQIPNVNLGNDTLICEGNSLTLDAGPGQTYVWSTGVNTQTITISQPTSATYWVYVDGGNNTRCTNSDSIYVEIVPMPNFNIGQDTCVNEPLTIGPDGLDPLFDWYYEWSTGSADSALNITQSGVYTLSVTNKPGSGCYRSDTRLVNIVDASKWIAENSGVDICTHQSHELVGPKAPAGHSYVYIWQMNGVVVGNNNYYVLNDLEAGKHVVTLSVGGCEVSVEVEARHCPLEPPNVITPNGDGINDVFAIDNLQYFPGSTIVIFNRWGKKVYESLDYQNNWGADGNADGVYYYILRIKDGKDTEMSGSITVMR